MKYLQYIIGIVILAIILSRIDLKHAQDALSKLNVPLLLAISLITIPQIFLKSLRWRYLLYLQGIEYSAVRSFITYAKGIYLGVITPARTGELIKVMYLKNEKNVEIGRGASSVLLDRFFDLYILLFIGMFSCLRFSVKHPAIWVFLIGMLVLVPAAGILLKIKDRRNGLALMGELDSFYQGFKKIFPKGVFVAILLTIIIYSMFFAQCYLLSRLVPLNLSFLNVVFISSMASLVALIPISALGIGTRDATIVYFFGKIGIETAKGVIYSFLMFFSFYIIGTIVGFLCWNIKIKNPQKTE